MTQATQQHQKAKTPHYWVRVEYRDGELGDALERAETALAEEARSAGLWVSGVLRAPARVLNVSQEKHGKNKEGHALVRTVRTCEVFSLLDTEARPGAVERWVRLTTPAGPAAVEVLEVPQSALQQLQRAGVRRATLHPMDLRSISTGFARTALEEG